MRIPIHSVWSEDQVPDAPARVWRDWVFLAAIAISAAIEFVVRNDIRWPIVSGIACAAMAAAVPLRRRYPLHTLVWAFGLANLPPVVSALTGNRETVGLYTVAFILVFVYSNFRWGSGRHMRIGVAVMIAGLAIGSLTEPTTLGDMIGGAIVLFFPAVLGLEVRYQNRFREQRVEEIRHREREQLARELHDSVAHHVSAIAIQAQAGLAVADKRPEAAIEALHVVEEAAARTLDEMRNMVSMLRFDDDAQLLPQQGVADIERLGLTNRQGPRVEVELTGHLSDLRPSVDAALFRLAQESITNSTRHARNPTTVKVCVEGGPEKVRLTVSDDGELPGLNGSAQPGYGLLGMAERTKLLGGSFTAGPHPGRGWVVTRNSPDGR